MDLGEIIRESWGVYKRNFMTLVIPFFVLAIAISVVFSFIGTGSVTYHFNDNTVVIAGENLSSPDLLDNNDGDYFEVRGDETHGLKILHDSRPIPQIHDGWILVCLNFSSSIPATYHLDIYNFSEDSWENGGSGEVETEGVSWIIKRMADAENYLSDENFIRVRVTVENTGVICREDSLVYEVIQPPEFVKILVGYFALFLGLTFCCGMVIGTTQQAVSKKCTKLGDALRIGGRSYPRLLATTLMIAIPLMGFLYFFLSYAWDIFLIIPAFLFLFFCAYAWQGVMIRSLSPWSSIGSSFKVTWENFGATFLFCLLLVLVWIIGSTMPIVGTFIVWFFFPFWVVALSVIYLDRIGELPDIKMNPKKSSFKNYYSHLSAV